MGVTLSYNGLGGKLKFSGTSGRFRTVYTKPLLLSLYPGAAGAYSLRKLSSTYAGSAIRVRRSSDNTETNIGFNSTDGLDTTSLTSFVGAGSGFVTTWYDQSGNSRNLVQTTTANQPIIVNTGTIQIINGKPVVYFDTTLKNLSIAYGFPGANSFIFDVLQSNDTKFVLYHGASGGLTIVSAADSADANAGINYSATVSNYYKNAILQTSPTNRVQVYNLISTNSQILLTYKLQLSAWSAFNLSGYGANEFVHYKNELVIYNVDKTSDRAAIESNINSYYSIYTPTWQGTGTALLDLYPSAAGAYSLRNLSSTYLGPLIRVRRSSDNAEMDVYGTFAGVLDAVSLLSFVGTGNGFVTRWYDQSGNSKNATQATAASQPSIVNSGNLLTLNNKPALGFYAFQYLVNTNTLTYGDFSVFMTTKWNSDLVLIQYSKLDLAIVSNTTFQSSDTGIASIATYPASDLGGVQKLHTHISTLSGATTTSTLYLNGTQKAIGTRNLTSTKSTISIGATDTGTLGSAQNNNEIIIYASNQITNKTGIESNINSYYTIY